MEDLVIGFTGTQEGMNASQLERLTSYLKGAYDWATANGYRPVFSHGDCIGSDDTAARTAKNIGFFIRAYPPENAKKRAWCVANDEVYKPAPYLTRNRYIVAGAHYMVATPRGPEVLRSGTWATIRFSQLQNKRVDIFYP